MLRHLCLLLVSTMFFATVSAQGDNTARPEVREAHNPYDCAIGIDSISGDILVKLVSYSPEVINVDVDLTKYISKKGKATVTTIEGVVMGGKKSSAHHPRIHKGAPADKHFSNRHGMRGNRHGKEVERDSVMANFRDHGKMHQWGDKKRDGETLKEGNFGKPGDFNKRPFGMISAENISLKEESIRIEPKNTVNLGPYSIVVIRVKR